MIELSIVTGSVNRTLHLAKFIQSIYKYTSISFELIILDASDVPIELNNKPDNLTILREPKKLGYAKGYNKGFEICQGKYVTFLNDDCEVLPFWDIEAVRFMDKNPWCGLGAIYFSELGNSFCIRDWLDLPYANFGIIEKSFGDSLGWFDDYLYTYGADNSLTFKVLLAGKGIAGIPNSKILHNPIMDLNKTLNLNRQSEDARNLLNRYRHLLPNMISVQRQFPRSAQYVI